MQKLFSLFLLWITGVICFSQQVIRDPHSGMEMVTDGDRQFLKVVNIIPGSPADISPLRIGDIITNVDGRKISELTDPESYFLSLDKSSVALTIRTLKENEVVVPVKRVKVNLYEGNYLTEAQLFNSTNLYQSKSVNNFSYDPGGLWNNFDNIIQTVDHPEAYRVSSSGSGDTKYKYCTYNTKLYRDRPNQMTVLGDNSRDFSAYKSFDFDYSSQDDPLMEKTLLNKLEKHLLKMGLERNSQDPDMLILINFYSGQKEQYVPPQQIISTRIQSYFNWYWGYIPVPVTESETKSGYTDVSYLMNLSLKFLDAGELSQSKTPPVIWSASYSEVSKIKVFISDYADVVYTILLHQYPVVANENALNVTVDNFAYTGLIYDKTNLKLAADVIPGSPADLAGIRKGDEIHQIHVNKFGKKEISMENSMAINEESPLTYLFFGSNVRSGDPRLFYPFYWRSGENKVSTSQSILFSVRRNGKKMDLQVKPEYKKTVFIETTGFISD